MYLDMLRSVLDCTTLEQRGLVESAVTDTHLSGEAREIGLEDMKEALQFAVIVCVKNMICG